MTLTSSIESQQPTGHRTAFSAVGIPASEELHQIGNHRWRPGADVSLSLEDVGSLQGATLVERLRTVHGRPLDVAEHLGRLKSSADELNIQWPRYLTEEVVHQCVKRNQGVHAAPDFGIVVLLTPGLMRSQPLGSSPTVIVYSVDLHWEGLAHWYRHGQSLVIAPNRNVPVQCWSPHMKTRSRMHYFLADQAAANSSMPYAGAIMLSLDGHVTETSNANLLLIEGEGLVSPPIDSVLHGLSLRRTVRLAEQNNVPVRFEPITVEAAQRASGVLLTGSSGCLWPASHIEGVGFADPTQHPVYQSLQKAWSDEIGLEYTVQAIERALVPRG